MSSQRGGAISTPVALLPFFVMFFFFFCPLFGFCSSLPAGGQCEYRRALPPSFLFKFFVEVSVQLEACSLSAGPDGDLPPAPIIGDSDRRELVLEGICRLTCIPLVIAGSDVNP